MPVLLNSAPIPADDAIARKRRPEFRDRPDPLEGHLTLPWREYLTRLGAQVNEGPSKIATVSLTEQAASIPGTDIAAGNLSGGLYRATYYIRITRPATVSSSLAIAFAWTDGGVAQAAAGTALTANTTQTFQTNFVMVNIDAASPIQYATTYASVGATTMLYMLSLTLERL